MSIAKLSRTHHQARSAKQRAIEAACKLVSDKKYIQAIENLEGYQKKYGKDGQSALNLGICHFNVGATEKAARIFHELHADDPNDYRVIKYAAITYMKLGVYSVALQFLKAYVKKYPNEYEMWLNLAHASGANQNNTECIYYATQAISLNPVDPRSYINLGAGLLALQKLNEARVAFETALDLDPKSIGAKSNLALIHEKNEEYDQAGFLYQNCIDELSSSPIEQDEMKYRASFALLSKGEIELGWDYYEHGFKPLDTRSRFPKRKFKVPQWSGQVLDGESLLIWKEQGVGDDFLFFSIINEVYARCQSIIIETDPRMVDLIQRSFPKALVRAQAFDGYDGQSLNHDFDYHIPAGSLPRLFRRNLESFSKSAPYLKPSETWTHEFKRRLSAYAGKKLIGICWRSGLLNSERNKEYAPISDWKDIFSIPDAVFVNLQYGDCENEISAAEQEFGVNIVRWSDVNLKDEFDKVAALIACLNQVVSARTAVAAMSEALGVNTKSYASAYGWDFLGQKKWLWFPNADVYVPKKGGFVSDVIPLIANDLIREYSKVCQ